jgi:hypothetical protein
MDADLVVGTLVFSYSTVLDAAGSARTMSATITVTRLADAASVGVVTSIGEPTNMTEAELSDFQTWVGGLDEEITALTALVDSYPVA